MKTFFALKSLYSGIFISGSAVDLLCHWIIRIFHFGVMWFVIYSIIWIDKFILSHKYEVGIGVVIILSIMIMVKIVIWSNDRKKSSIGSVGRVLGTSLGRSII